MRGEYRYQSSFNRPNLHYEVRKKDNKTIDIIADYIGDRRAESGVIYCLSRKDCETLSDKLNDKLREKGFRDVRVSFYHAELSLEERKSRHHAWSMGRISLLCATIAFGMGIDKPDGMLCLGWLLSHFFLSLSHEHSSFAIQSDTSFTTQCPNPSRITTKKVVELAETERMLTASCFTATKTRSCWSP
jgi:superfamily II DNA helicase RecQ